MEKKMKREEVDVLVVGSGAGGLSSAVAAAHRGLKVIVAEKEAYFGGTTARSGGWMWIPGNAPAKRAGVEDSAEKARTYLQHETGDKFDAARVDAFLEAGPKAVDFFEKNTTLQLITAVSPRASRRPRTTASSCAGAPTPTLPSKIALLHPR